MATTTTNFGWDIPQSTDLVKDGATAIAGLGQDIDTSMADLKGGTSGQILSKASNTDMDFAWVTPNPGDITSVTAGTGLTGGGTSGDVTVSFDVANYGGGQYAAGKNAVINGGFDIWQRGTSFTPSAATGTYTADRWQVYRNVANYTVSRQATSDTTNLPFIQYCMRLQRTAATTNTDTLFLLTSLETINSIPFAGKTITISFYARAGANFSAASGAFKLDFQYGTGTDQNLISGYTGGTGWSTQTSNLTTTWQRFSYTGTVASTATEMGMQFSYVPVGTAGANDYFEITGVQLELGSTATPFSRAGGTIQGELAACQRYYERVTSEALYGVMANGKGYDTGKVQIFYPYKVTKRVTPTSIDTSAMATFQIETGSTSVNTPTAVTYSSGLSNTQLGGLEVTKAASFTTGAFYIIQGNNSTTAYIGWNSEL